LFNVIGADDKVMIALEEAYLEFKIVIFAKRQHKLKGIIGKNPDGSYVYEKK